MLKLLFFATTFIAATAQADTYVRGYHRKNGTYVQPHSRSDSNHSKLDNWSTKGNTNPYTGKRGTKDPYGSSYDSSYGSDKSGSSQNDWND